MEEMRAGWEKDKEAHVKALREVEKKRALLQEELELAAMGAEAKRTELASARAQVCVSVKGLSSDTIVACLCRRAQKRKGICLACISQSTGICSSRSCDLGPERRFGACLRRGALMEGV